MAYYFTLRIVNLSEKYFRQYGAQIRRNRNFFFTPYFSCGQKFTRIFIENLYIRIERYYNPFSCRVLLLYFYLYHKLCYFSLTSVVLRQLLYRKLLNELLGIG